MPYVVHPIDNDRVLFGDDEEDPTFFGLFSVNFTNSATTDWHKRLSCYETVFKSYPSEVIVNSDGGLLLFINYGQKLLLFSIDLSSGELLSVVRGMDHQDDTTVSTLAIVNDSVFFGFIISQVAYVGKMNSKLTRY